MSADLDSTPPPATEACDSELESDDAAAAELPSVSTVVPVYNDPAGIDATLEALTRQSYPDDRHEIVVVDNGSTDGTRAVVRDYCAAFETVRLVVEDEIQSSYAARNRGVRATSGSVLAFVDADMIVDSRWIERIARQMSELGADYLACNVELFTAGEEGLVGKYNRLNDLHVERFVEEQRFAPTCCLVARRDVFDELGPFDDRLVSGGDFEFGNRVFDDDRRLRYASDITMYHPTRTTLGALLRKAKRVGRGKTQLRRYYPNRYGHPVAQALNPAAYLPPVPQFLSRSIREWSTLSRPEQVAFFLLTYLTSLAKAYGQLAELVDPTDTDG